MTKSQVDDNLKLLASRQLRGQVRKLSRHLEGVRRGDSVEDLHQARVASRRLRVGLKLFLPCWDAEKVRRWRKELRQLTKRLGDTRDTDIQILFLKEFLDKHLSRPKDKRLRAGVERLLKAKRKKRRKLQKKVGIDVDSLDDSSVLDELLAELGKLLVSDSLARASKSGRASALEDVPGDAVRQLGHDRINECLVDLLSRQGCLEDPGSRGEHHQMRIAAKRLRYTMETLSPAFPGKLKTPIRAAKKMQTILGDMHDCDVWIEYLEKAIAQNADSQDRPGLEYLLEDRAGRWHKLFSKSVTTWRCFHKDGVWSELVSLLEESAPASALSNKTLSNLRRLLQVNVREAGH